MEIRVARKPWRAAPWDLLALPASPSWPDAQLREVDRALGGLLLRHLRQCRFRPEMHSVATLPCGRELQGRYVAVVGIPSADAAGWRVLADGAVQLARQLCARAIALPLPAPEAAEPAALGLQLAAYRFSAYRTKSDPRRAYPAAAALLHPQAPSLRPAIRRAQLFARATCYARDLVNLPAAVVTPRFLAREATRLAKQGGLRARVFSPERMHRLGFHSVLAVGRGSAEPPRFIEIAYRPAGTPRARIALVGKGITFDSGGLTLKNPEAMRGQKRDMAGAAVVLAVLSVARELGLQVELRGCIPAAENMPSGSALKPGDVVRTFAGTTVEVLNPDAEGRLLLADALSYAARARPDAIIDVATLTGAVRSALGPRYAALLGSDDGLCSSLLQAARAEGEGLWRLPLVEEYRSDLESKVADLRNTGEGYAGTIVAALFLREFTGGIPWAHIDCSSTAVAEREFACHPPGATGFGVRTLLRFLLAPPPLGARARGPGRLP